MADSTGITLICLFRIENCSYNWQRLMWPRDHSTVDSSRLLIGQVVILCQSYTYSWIFYLLKPFLTSLAYGTQVSMICNIIHVIIWNFTQISTDKTHVSSCYKCLVYFFDSNKYLMTKSCVEQQVKLVDANVEWETSFGRGISVRYI